MRAPHADPITLRVSMGDKWPVDRPRCAHDRIAIGQDGGFLCVQCGDAWFPHPMQWRNQAEILESLRWM